MPQLKVPKKIDLTPKKRHGFQFIIFLLGCFIPPFAVGLRFGIGSDFFLNCILTICGYIPGHFHNFYVQNVRNNTNKNRTPKWVRKHGLVDDSEDIRKKAKSQWSGRYNERNPQSSHFNAELAEGEEGSNYIPRNEMTEEEIARRKRAGLWTREEEEYYGEENEAPNQRSWHYPANFEGTDIGEENAPDRFTRSQQARDDGFVQSNPGFAADTYVSNSRSTKKPSKSKSAKRAAIAKYAPSGNGGHGGGFDNPPPNSRFDSYNGAGGPGDGNGRSAARESPNLLDASYDNDVPEWGRDYGASRSNAPRRELGSQNPFNRNLSDNGGNGYGDYGAGAGGYDDDRHAGSAKAASQPARQVEENWDHQF